VTQANFLQTLERIIRDRIDNPVAGSYTASLIAAGNKRIAQKVGEEGVELALAAVTGDRDETVNEAADLLFHVLVLLQQNGIRLEDVERCLEERHSGN
jgi:phosphoribosyl-ATP pyrophosphohydrolase/phosphoribosyl-AMP cyclohydrolase